MTPSERLTGSFQDQEAVAIWARIWRQLDPTSPEFAALQAVAHGMLFLFAPLDAFFGESGQVVATEEEMLRHQQRGHAYIAYLSPWVQDALTRATDEQRQFLRRIGLSNLEGTLSAEPSPEPSSARPEALGGQPPAPPPAETFPDLTDAVSLLEALARRFDRSTLEHLGIELAVQTLTFIIASGQTSAFRAYLEEVHQPVPPEKLARYGIPSA